MESRCPINAAAKHDFIVIGTFLAVMLWMYYASVVAFFGAEIVRALGQNREDASNTSNVGPDADQV